MGDVTAIAWTDRTFNGWIGCTKVSTGPEGGCEACYAEVRDQRFEGGAHWGPGAPRRRTSEENWRKPLAWNREAEKARAPLKVFAHSLSDVFDNEVPDDWRRDLFELWACTPWLRWQVLTKRIGNAAGMLRDCMGWPLRNVGLVATVVTQDEADRDVPKLLATPAAWRGLSIEPQQARILVDDWLPEPGLRSRTTPDFKQGAAVEWVITGGESKQTGHEPRPYRIAWARSLITECDGRCPVFVKQMGARPLHTDGSRMWLADSRAGADPAEWPADLRVREFPAQVLR